jgi:hypothetical protein
MVDFDEGSPQRNFFRAFTGWWPWARRSAIPDGHGYKIDEYSGVYLLAHFAEPPPEGPASHLDDAIMYVGEGAWLRRRWRQFERSAQRGLPGHHGGFAYLGEYGDTRWGELHVAALPIWFGERLRSAEPWTRAYRLHAERRILWELTVHRNGETGGDDPRPLLNRR